MKFKHRALSLLLSVVMVLSYMPAMTFAVADDTADAEVPAAAEEQAEADAEEVTEEKEPAGSDDSVTTEQPDGQEPDGQAAPEDGQETSSVPKESSANPKHISSRPAKAVPGVDVAGNDELLGQYFSSQVDDAAGTKPSGIKLRAKKATRRSKLNEEIEQPMYDAILNCMEQVAAGSTGSSQFVIDLSEELEDYLADAGDGSLVITAESLGIDGPVYVSTEPDNGDVAWDLSEDAKAALFDIEKIVDAILADNPYPAYWFDKLGGYAYGLNVDSVAEDGSAIYFTEDPEFGIDFTVAEAYRAEGGDEYTADQGKASAATEAVAGAKKILAENSEKSDVEKLTAYKDAVCDLTDYNDEAAENPNPQYGDPWQLIYVFDNNENTTVVCEGYAKAFQFLCDRGDFSDDDIECHTVTGEMSGGTGAGLHMWNILHMDDGRNYMADITNSDDGNAGEDGELFLAPALEGSVDDGYGYMDANEDGNPDINYEYDSDTRRIYDDEELEMSMTPYEDADEPGSDPEESVIPLSLGERVTVTATHEKNYQLYSFTPEEDGYYRFGSIGSVDSIGYIGSIDGDVFDEENFNDDGGIDSNFELYFDASAGQTVYLKAALYGTPEEGSEVTFDVQVTKDFKVESIELNMQESLSYCEHTHGYWSTDGNGDRIWIYNFPGFKPGDTLTVSDGSDSIVYSFDYYNGFVAEGRDNIYLSPTTDEWETGGWSIGVHEYVFSYGGVTASVPVEINASSVETIAFTPAEPLVYYEGVNGQKLYDQFGEEYTEYYFPWFREGDTLTVDGTDYVFSTNSYRFISEGGDMIDPNGFDWISTNQYEDHWDIGRHEFEFGYMGKFTTYPVEVAENPVRSIEFIPASPYIYYEGIDSYGTETDDEGNEHYLYNTPYCRKGDRLIINGTDTYTAGIDGTLIGPDGDYVDWDDIRFSSEQYLGEYWELGSSNYVTITYYGRTCTVPVTIMAPTVVEISYQPAEDYVLLKNVDGWTEREYVDDEEIAEWFCYHEPYKRDGDILTVDNKQYKLRNQYYISADGERINAYEVQFRTDQSVDNQWSIDDEGGHAVTISYGGASCTVPVVIEENPVTGIEFEPAQPYTFYEHASGSWEYYDEDYPVEEEKFYYYEIPGFRERDKLTVYRGEESTVYTLRYDENSGRVAFFTDDGSDSINRWDIERETSQYEEPWEVGGTYQITLSYMGVSCSVDAVVVENPIESIEYEPAGGALSITENLYGYWDDEEDEEYFHYYSPYAQKGDRIIVHMVSGDETTYKFRETQYGTVFADINDDSNRLDEEHLRFYLNQDEEWKAGNTYNCTVEYMGAECLTQVYIAENNVLGFAVTLAEPLRIKDSALAMIEQYEDDEDIYPPELIDGWDEERGPFRTGDYISVTTTLGTQRYTLRDDHDYFDDGNGNRIYCYEIEIWDVGSWTPGGDPQLIMSFMNMDADPVDVEEYTDTSHVHSMVYHDPVAAGCLTKGYAGFWYCWDCDRYFADEDGQQAIDRDEAVLGAAGHNWGNGTVTKEATCVERGVMTFTCSGCGETRTQPIPTTTHRWDEGEITYPSTCTDMGTREYTCEICGETRYEYLPLGEHGDLVHVDAQEPTCEYSGNIEYWYCSNCGKYFSDEDGENEIESYYLPPLPHALTEHPAVAATCEQNGYKEYWTCDDCGAMFADAQGTNRIYDPEVIEATGHDWGDWELTTEPTCTEYGVETRVCANDNSHKDTRWVDPLDHEWTGEREYVWSGSNYYVTATVACSRDPSHKKTETSYTSYEDTATCTEPGVRTYTAEFNGEWYETQTKEVASQPLGHDYWDIPDTAIAAECEKAGKKADRKCSRCDSEVEGEVIPALGHDYRNIPDTAIAAECEKEGKKADRKCSRCDSEVEGEVIPALGHNYQNVPDTAIAAGCETEGRTADRRCSRCDDVIEGESTPALGHNYREQTGTAVAAECEKAGKKADRKCSRCDDVIEGESTPALGHNYQDVAGTAVAAGCETEGKHADKKCSRCGAVITGETIAPLNHDPRKTDAKPATCLVNGNIEYWKCNTCGKLFSDAEAATEITEADTVIPADGHVWGEPVFTFSEGGGSATATRTCLKDGSHTETVDAVVTSEITRIATATEPGEITYTATAVFDEQEYTGTKAVEANTYLPESIKQLAAIGGTHKIELSWTRSHEVNSEVYCIYRREALTDQKQLIKKIYSRDKLTYTDTDVIDGKKYTYYVTCQNGYGQESSPSPEATAAAMEDTEAPVVVQMSPAANAMIGGTQTITAKATDNVQVTSIILEVSSDGTTWQQIAQAEASSISYELDTTAYASGSIHIRAVAYDAAQNESDAFSREYVIDNDSPAQVQNLTAEATASTVTLKWDDNTENDIKFYRVEQITGGDQVKKIEDVNSLGVVIHGLKSSAEYTYQVAAYDLLGNRGTPSERVTVTTADDNIAPVIVSIRPEPSFVSGELEISVNARDNMGLASVVIQHSGDGLSWTDLDEVEFEGSPEEATAKRSVNTDDLEEGSLFVRAKVTDVNGNENDYISMEPVEYKIDRTKPAKVTGLVAEAQPGSIGLSWVKSAEDDLKGYHVYRSEDGEEFTLITKTSSNKCTDHTASTPGKTYIYKVAAADAAGNTGDLSDAVSVTASADTEAPVIEAYEPSTGSEIGPGKKTFSILVSDNSALASMRVTYTVDSRDDESDITEEQILYENDAPDNYYLNISGDLPVDDLNDGDVVSVHIYATDTSGNELADHEDITYRVDKTAPVVSGLTATVENQSVKLQIMGNGAEDLLGYYIYRKGTDGQSVRVANVPSSGRNTDYDYHDFCEYTDTSVEAGASYTYMAVAYDKCGNTGFRESEEVIIPDQVILEAELTCDDLMEGGVEYYFSGIKSESNLGIREFSFDFGDGSDPVTGPEARVIHRYKEPDEDDADGTDTYTVTLTVTDNDGNTDEISRVVKVKRQSLVGTVTVTVVNPSGGKLSNVPVYFDMDNTLERVKFTDTNGQVKFVSDTGLFSIGAYSKDYLPIRRTMTVNASPDNELTLTMTEKEIVTGRFEVKRLTLDEIRELGIDTSDPASMHYARINVVLTYGEFEAVVDDHGLIKEIIKTIGGIDIIPVVHDKNKEKPPIDWPEGWGGGPPGPDPSPGGGFYSSAPEIPFVAVLEVPVETSFLKEFFDVKLHLINNASSEFTITDNMVSLNVPDGMTLLDLEQTDGAVVQFDSFRGQETKTIDWCLRGDETGSYNLTADYSGVLKEFATSVSGSFTTSEPINVLGLSAGKVIMEVDPQVLYGAFYTKISLQNVGDADMYLPSIGIVDDLIHATERYGKKNEEGELEEVTIENDKPVTLINEYLEDDAGYCQAIPPGGIETLSKGQMLSRRYACYDAIQTEDFAELKDACYEIAEGYGIGFEFRIRQHDYYDIEEGDVSAAQAKKDFVLGKNGKSMYQWIKDSKNQNFYYYIQGIDSRKNLGTSFSMQSHRVLSCVLSMDLDLFTNEDKKDTTRKYISEIMRDEKYAEQLEDRLEDEYLEVASDVIDWMGDDLEHNHNLQEEDVNDIKSVLKSSKNIRKLIQDLRNGEPETFRDRVLILLSSTSLAADKELMDRVYYSLLEDGYDDKVEDAFKDSVSSKVSSLGELVSTVNTLVGAYNDSAEIYNQLLIIWTSKEQATELLDMILKCNRDDIDHAVYDEVKALRKNLNDKYLDQSVIFMNELKKAARDDITGKLVGKGIALLDKHFFAGSAIGPIGAAYAIAGFMFEGADYALGWGTAVTSLQNLQIAADLTLAVRKQLSASEQDSDPRYFLTCLKYLIKLRLLGERAYIEAAKQEDEDEGILNMINDDYSSDYEDVDEYYRAYKTKLLSYRDSLFRDVEGSVDTPSAPQAGIDYDAETTLQTYSDEYEYSFGGIRWTDCNGEAIELSPGAVSRDLRIRRKADGQHPTGNSAYVAVPPRPEIMGDAVCKYMSVKGSDSVYLISGIPDGTYYYELTDRSKLDELGPDAQILTVSGGKAEITDSDSRKAPYIAIRRPAVLTGTDASFASLVRTIAAEEIKSGDINVVEVPHEADVTGVAEEFLDEAGVVTAETEGTVLAEAAAEAAEASNVTAASVLPQLKNELAGKEGSGVTDSTRVWDVRLIMQTYLDMKVLEITADEDSSDIKSIVVDITPMSRIIASTKGIEDQDISVGTNAILVGEEQVLDLSGQKTTLRIKLPASFNNEAGIVYVTHNNTEEYVANIVQSDPVTGDITIEFETDGFSPFRVSVEPEAIISVDGVGYTSMSAAIAAAKDGDTITLKGDVTEAVTVSGKNLTINCGSYDANITAGEKTVVTRSGSKENGDLVIDIHYHAPFKVEAAEPTYKDPGHAEHWKCSCGKLFSDEEGLTEITAESIQTPSLKDQYSGAASTAVSDKTLADTKVSEANEALRTGATDEAAELKVNAAVTAADTAVTSANTALEAAETAIDAAQEEDAADAKNLEIAAKRLVADASSTKAEAQKAVAKLSELRADAAKDNAASQPKGTQEAVDAAQAALDAANAAKTAAEAAKDAAQAAADAAKAAAQAAGTDPEEDAAYKAAKNALEEAKGAAQDAADAVTAAETALQTAKDDKDDADALAEARTSAIADLDAVDTSVYSGEDKTNVENAIDAARTAIENAATVEAVTNALNEAKTTISAQKTDTQKEAEAKAAEQAQAVTAAPAPAEIIDLPAVKITKPAAAKKKITVKWKKVSKKNQKKISGIQIEVATDPGFTNIVKTAKAGKKKTSKKIGGLQPKTKYYVRIRAYGADNHYSVWKGKSVKVK